VGQPLPGQDMRYPLVVSSVASGELRDVEQTFSPVAELGYERLARLRNLAGNPEEAVEIGQRLFRVLLREPNYEMLRRSLKAARKQGKAGLRLRLRLDDPALQSYPWELCHDGRSFIFNNPDAPILLTRTVGVDAVQTPPPLPRPVRLLVAIAAPTDQGHIDVYNQEKIIHYATEELVTSSELDYQIIQHTTLRELESAVQSFQPNIVQFIGHSSGEKEGALVLENMSSLSNLVPVSEIRRILAPAPVQCVILSPVAAGERNVSQFGSQFIPGGSSSQNEPNQGTGMTQLAPQFIQQGIPTVLAGQFMLAVGPAVQLWKAFYHALLFDRLSFEEAIQNTRHHLATTDLETPWYNIGIFYGAIRIHEANNNTVYKEVDILIYEDDVEWGMRLRKNARSLGYSSILCTNEEEFDSELESSMPQIILLATIDISVSSEISLPRIEKKIEDFSHLKHVPILFILGEYISPGSLLDFRYRKRNVHFIAKMDFSQDLLLKGINRLLAPHI
ncbi:MAG: CHAT domain-containing protein, partial [Anaerolineales bacterium]|nr:CHAT domain-containing protein [Anaerolineales bacterium]